MVMMMDIIGKMVIVMGMISGGSGEDDWGNRDNHEDNSDA